MDPSPVHYAPDAVLPPPSSLPGPSAPFAAKGKARGHPPTLPPLSLDGGDDGRSSPPSPSSDRSPSPPASLESTDRVSLHSTPSMSRLKIKLAASSKTPVTLARRLLSRNKADVATPSIADTPHAENDDCLCSPWQSTAALDLAALPCPDSRHPAASRGKARSYSSPLPGSASHAVPQIELDPDTMPLPLCARDLFDETLPRELRIRVFSALISLHEADHDQLKNSAKWSVQVASSSKNRWVGRDRAFRELVKLSRVSKLWRTLVFDGQLWQRVDLRAFPTSTITFLPSLIQLSGPFIQHLDLSGHSYLSPTALIDMAGDLGVRSAPTANVSYTQLTGITLQGCTSLTTQSLHSLLIQSPFLRSLDVKGLQAVTNTTFHLLALCSHLTSLNMNRCPNIDGDGVYAFAAAGLERGTPLPLTELRLSGLAMVNDDILATLGKAAPHLQVLDLSYCRSLHNSALEAFVSCPEDGADAGETVWLTAREAGRDPSDWRRYRRRVTALRHISLSSCIMLTDNACSNLAYAVPRLEFLELAGIGQTLKDDGLVRLLGTTPFIRELDLEDAADITDAVLDVLTPTAVEADGATSSKRTPPQPGHALEHLIVSYATNLTNDAFEALICGCPRLRVLEADSTSISGAVLKEFVRQVRERGIHDAGLVLVDCHTVGERSIKDVVANTRPRRGWRSWEARKLGYLDGRDGEDIKVGQDECDEKRVVLKSFSSWQTVDAVQHARERKKKKAHSLREHMSEPEEGMKLSDRMRSWATSRMSSRSNTPSEDSDREGCVVM